MTFELTILGSSSALPTSKRFPTAHLLNVNERFFLIDCGEGTQVQLRRFGLSPARINHIFISHLHGDHVFGLFGLISTFGLMGRKADLNIYGPPALEELLETHLRFFGPLPFPLKFNTPTGPLPAVIYEDSRITVTALELKHRTPTLGYLFREKDRLLNVRKDRIGELGVGVADIMRIKKGEDYTTADGRMIPNKELTLPAWHSRSYAYLSDTKFTPSLVPYIRGVDLLFHEATFMEKDLKLARETWHSTAREAALMAEQAGAGRLLIGHFSSRYKDLEELIGEARTVFPETSDVNDGDRFSLPLTRVSTEVDKP
ncbi:MAG: ribonuclease Z [Bacteroidota bacterium]